MGNVTSLSPSQILPLEHYIEKALQPQIWNQSKLKKHLGSTRFMKVGHIEHESEDGLLVKIFVIPDVAPNEKDQLDFEIQRQIKEIRSQTAKLQHLVTVVPWMLSENGDKAAYLIRQFISRSLYDRLNTRPFLTFTEKKWIAYQLLRALETIHMEGVIHGDLKCENILLTSDDWLLLGDFASFKPTQLPSDNPAEFTYFFDTSRRRVAYLAPERFMERDDTATLPEQALSAPMDIFSAGCIIAELFNEKGDTPLFTYSDILAFTEGSFEPDLTNLPVEVAKLVKIMISRSSKERPSAARLAQSELFPANFSKLYDIIKKYKQLPRKDFGFSGDDILPKLQSSGDLDFIVNLPPDECVIPLSMILNAMQNTDFQSTKFRSFKIIAHLTRSLSDQIIFERIFPTILKFTKCINRNDVQVRSRALITLCDLIVNLKPDQIQERECKMFQDFLSDLCAHSKDPLFSVRRTFARIIGDLAESAVDFAQRSSGGGNDQSDDPFGHVRRLLAETTTTIMTDESREIKQTFMHFSVKQLARILGQNNTGDIILHHMITYLNDKHNNQLRAEFYNVLPDVVASINQHSTEVLGTIIRQGLVDSDELVISAALKCFVRLIKMDLMSKYLALEVASEAAPLLLFPNSGILSAAALFFAALAETINTAEKLVQLYPIILPYFRKPNKAAFESVTSILTFLRKPLTRSVYDVIIGQFKQYMTNRDKKSYTLDDFIGILPKDRSIDIDQIDLVEHKDFDVLLRRIRNAGKIDHDDIKALELMSSFITEQVKKASHSSDMMKHQNYVDIEQMERDQGGKVRNYCKLEPSTANVGQDAEDLKSKVANQSNAWDRPYRSHIRPAENIEERNAISRIALRSTVQQKRNAYRVKMVEDLQNICLDWDPCGQMEANVEDIWKPKGRLVAHVNQHNGPINQVALNANNSQIVTASDDASIRIWNTDQFSNHSKPSSEYKSRNNWSSKDGHKVKRASFTELTRVAVTTNTSLHYLDTENLKAGGWSVHFDAKKDGIITDMITSPSMEDKGEIILATSFGHIIGYDPRVGSEVYRLNHLLKHGFITSMCGDKRQHWVTVASSRGYITVFDLRFNLKCRSFAVHDDQLKINKIVTHPTEPCHIAASIDGNNNCGVWNLESGLRDYALWASPQPPLSTERDPSNHSIRALTYTNDGGVLFTGGTDRRIRSWVMNRPSASEVVAQAATDQTDGLRVTVSYSERKIEGVQLIQETSKRQRVQHEESDWGLLGAPQGHWDSVSSLQVLQIKNQKLLLSASRDGVMKVWK